MSTNGRILKRRIYTTILFYLNKNTEAQIHNTEKRKVYD